jgi:hypothetical protein
LREKERRDGRGRGVDDKMVVMTRQTPTTTPNEESGEPTRSSKNKTQQIRRNEDFNDMLRDIIIGKEKK